MKHIISQPWGGLGDSLQFSTLPEELAKRGDEVFLSRTCAMRNADIFTLVWLCNPFLRGLSEDPATLGHPAQPFEPSLSDNIVQHWEISAGLSPTKGLPRIYKEPVWLGAYEDLVVVDVSSTSIGYDQQALRARLEEVYKRYPDVPIAQVSFANYKPAHNFQTGWPSIPVDNLVDYWNILYSCRAFVTVFSGASVLAAAMLERWRDADDFKPVVLRPREHRKGYIFPGVEYVDV